jgi:hypothetical protein
MKIFILLLACFLSACTDSSSVKQYAEIDGWDSYEVTGYRWFGCSKEDFYNTGFKATKNGKIFTGVVCKGILFRGATLRLD